MAYVDRPSTAHLHGFIKEPSTAAMEAMAKRQAERDEFYASLSPYECEMWDRIYVNALARGAYMSTAADAADAAMRYRRDLWGEHRKQ